MLGIALQSAWQRRRRLAGTAAAITLGVAFLVGTLVLGDTFAANFDRLFTDTAAGTDVVVRSAVSVSDEPDARRGFIDAAILDDVLAVEGVAMAEAEISGYGQLLDAGGEPLGGNGPPRIAGTWIGEPDLNPYELVEGRAPSSDTEVVVNRGTAEAGELHLGDTTIVQTPRPVEVTIVGIATFGDEDGFGDTTFTAFTLEGAGRFVAGQADRISSVVVAGDGSVDADVLRDRVALVLPEGTEAITGPDLVDERLESLGFLSVVRVVLIGFAAVALAVATVSIHNTFTITVAQRTRELALLRAVGASKRQVRRLMQIEAAAVGAGSAVAGSLAGLGLAVGLKSVFAALGSGLPDGGLTVRPAVLAAGVAVGLAVTMLAARAPARRAGNLPPVAALRETNAEAAPGATRLAAGAVVTASGAVAALAGASGTAWLSVAGALGIVAGVLVLAPTLLAASMRPLRALTGGGGVNTAIAVDNIARQPRRNAAAATALVIGVAIVALFTVFAASATTAVEGRVAGGFGNADLAIATPAFGGGVLSPDILDDLAGLEAIGDALGTATSPVLVDGEAVTATATDLGGLEAILAAEVTAGELPAGDAAPAAVVDAGTAAEHGWRPGSTIEVGFADGEVVPLPIAAVIADHQLLDGIVLPAGTWIEHEPQPGYDTVFVTVASGIDVGTARAALGDLADRYTGEIQDRAELGASRSEGLSLMLDFVYVMLALAIVIALLGIANTLSLSVHERKREIGLLRAVGQTRRQSRRTLRVEAMLISTFGTLVGCAVGALGGAMLFGAAFDGGALTVPGGRLATIVVLGVIAGVAAAWRPARRSARLPILEAITNPS